MGLGEAIRRGAIGRGMRARARGAAVSALQSGTGDVGYAFNQLFAGFRTDIGEHALNRGWNAQAGAAEQSGALYFYGGAVLYVVRQFPALRSSAPPFWVMIFLAAHCGMGNDNETASLAWELVKAAEANQPPAQAGSRAMQLWLAGDVDGSAQLFARAIAGT